MTIEVLIPVFRRPKRIRPVVGSVRDSQADIPLVPVVIASQIDRDSHTHARAEGVELVILPGERTGGDYARKINFAIAQSKADWWLLGADDLSFEKGWAEEAMIVHEETGALVIATNDLGNQRVIDGKHATHPLVHRDFLSSTPDEGLLHEGYDHNFVDDELVLLALLTESFAAAPNARIEHLHPFWEKGQMDGTYRLGQRYFHQDRRLFLRRRRELSRLRPRRFQP